MTANGPALAEIASCTCCSIRLTVNVEKSGSFRSGTIIRTPRSANFLVKNAAFDDCGEDANPCR